MERAKEPAPTLDYLPVPPDEKPSNVLHAIVGVIVVCGIAVGVFLIAAIIGMAIWQW